MQKVKIVTLFVKQQYGKIIVSLQPKRFDCEDAHARHSSSKLNVYFGGKLGTSATDVQDMIRQYKAFDTAKVSSHMNGQQNVDFIDETHSTGTCYALATLVTEQEGKDVLTTHAVIYYDKYVKIDGRWWITECELQLLVRVVLCLDSATANRCNPVLTLRHGCQ